MIIYYQILLFFIGASIGSFLCAWVDRFNKDESIPRGRSVCDNCQRQLSWYELIPVLSYLFLRGRCRTCFNNIGVSKIFIEIFYGCIFIVWWDISSGGSGLYFELFYLIILSGLLFFDLKHFRLPDILIIPLLVAGLVNTVMSGLNFYLILSLTPAIIFAILYIVSKGEWVGFGDVKLLLALSFIGAYPLPLAIFVASIFIGSVIGILLIATGRAKLSTRIPFGSILTAVSILFIIFNEQISQTIFWNIF